ncbi:MAG: XRE family transcriptional regulator [Stellaceae bacterium]
MELSQQMAQRLKALRLAAGMSLQKVADRAQTTKTQIDRLERGKRRLTIEWVGRIAHALGLDPEAVLAERGAPPRPSADGGQRNMPAPRRKRELLRRYTVPSSGDRDLPVFGRGTGDMIVIDRERPIDFTFRPPQLYDVEDAFAVYIIDDTMEPRYRIGQIVLVNPHLPIRVGDAAVILHHDDTAVIRELAARDGKELRMRAYRADNGEKTLRPADYEDIFRIIGAIGNKELEFGVTESDTPVSDETNDRHKSRRRRSEAGESRWFPGGNGGGYWVRRSSSWLSALFGPAARSKIVLNWRRTWLLG